jgi:adenylosuccinate synthase
MGDLLRPAALPERLQDARRHYEQVFRGAGRPPEVDFDKLAADLAHFGETLGPRIADVSLVLHRQMAQGYSVLFEGAQATLLDVDHGTYPFVTSSSAGAGGALTGLGVAPTKLDGVIGIVKAYTTRVGAGPLPSEIGGALEDAIREKGAEFGASTGRPRRCGWFDAVVVRYSARVNGLDSLAVTKLDVLDDQPEVLLCTGYRYGGEVISEFPADLSILEGCEPVYEKMPGWGQPTAGVRDYSMLPEAARRYLDRIAELVGTEVGIVSTGPAREDTIIRGGSAVASWFD